MLSLRTCACLALMLALTSCSLAFPVTAWFRNGKLVFIIDGKDNEEWCWEAFEIIDHRGRSAWDFEAFDVPNSESCWRGVLTYGSAPKGAEIGKPAEPLQLGRIYVVDGRSTGSLYGAFYLYGGGGQLTVQNLARDDPRVQAIRDARYRVDRPGEVATN